MRSEKKESKKKRGEGARIMNSGWFDLRRESAFDECKKKKNSLEKSLRMQYSCDKS